MAALLQLFIIPRSQSVGKGNFKPFSQVLMDGVDWSGSVALYAMDVNELIF